MTEDERQTLEVLRKRKRGYQLALNAPGVQDMLADLAPFCRAVRLTDQDVKDATVLAMLVGRQQVWERIQHHFQLTVEQLYALYTGRIFHVMDEDDAE
jgi:hypothetical protein